VFTVGGQLPSEEAIRTSEVAITDIITDTAQFLHDASLVDRICILRMSDFFLQEGIYADSMGEDLLNLLMRIRGNIGRAFNKRKIGGPNCISTVCPDCKTFPAHSKAIQHPNKRIKDGKIYVRCHEQECNTGDYIVDVRRRDTKWLIFYCLCCLRDVLYANKHDKSVLRVFGGDYDSPWGESFNKRESGKGPPIAERIHGLMKSLGSVGSQCHQITGQLIVRNGQKLSKSAGDIWEGVDLDFVSRLFRKGDSVIELELK
jgi:hypothetical protein